MLITFEGLDYCGKSTQAKLLADRLGQQRNVLLLREPGGTRIGEQIRSLLLDKESMGMSNVSELFLFSASRTQLVEEIIKPALSQGTVVVCDRFYDSTTAYQGWGRGIPLDAVHAINSTATGGLVPEFSILIDIPIEEIEHRMKKAAAGKDRMESNGREFYERVRKGYLDLANKEKRFIVVDGMQEIGRIHETVWRIVGPPISKMMNS